MVSRRARADIIAVFALLCACGADELELDATATTAASSSGMAGGSSGAGSTGTSTGGSGGGSTVGTGGAAGGAMGGAGGGVVDLDGDGLDDGWEATIAKSYRPFLSLHPDDGCSLGGIVYRVTPHPADPAFVLAFYDHLFQEDCGLNGHVGDNEAFGVLVDPHQPPPAGILAVKAIGHQDTFCEKVTACGSCGGLPACATADGGAGPTPIVFSSKDKHASYVEQSQCSLFTSCFDECALANASADPPMVNAGEPSAHLTDDLTDMGFITAANGWTAPELMHFDPWAAGAEFGSAGVVADDLVDMAFVPALCP